MNFIEFKDKQSSEFAIIIDVVSSFHNEIWMDFEPESLIVSTLQENILVKVTLDIDKYKYKCYEKICIKCDVHLLLKKIKQYDLNKSLSITLGNNGLFVEGTLKKYYYCLVE